MSEDKDIIKIDLAGRKLDKNIRPFWTLIGGDSLRMLKHYLGSDFSEKREAIFINPLGKPVNATALKRWWLRHLIRIGIIEKEENGTRGTRYGYGLHELRDNFRTLWSQSRRNPDVGEFLMGHKIDTYEYNQIYRNVDYVIGEYRQALPLLNVLSGGFDPERDEKKLREKQALEDQLTEQGERIAELENLLEAERRLAPDEELREALRLITERLNKLEKQAPESQI